MLELFMMYAIMCIVESQAQHNDRLPDEYNGIWKCYSVIDTDAKGRVTSIPDPNTKLIILKDRCILISNNVVLYDARISTSMTAKGNCKIDLHIESGASMKINIKFIMARILKDDNALTLLTYKDGFDKLRPANADDVQNALRAMNFKRE